MADFDPGKILDQKKVLEYYSRKDIQNAIVESAKNREIGVRFPNLAFGKRPDILQYPGDVLELVKQGVVAFNVSEERWSNPLHLRSGMTRKELDNLRIGFDLVIDIDSDFLEYTKIAADVIIKALQYYNVPLTIKFSGRAGFHIAVPWEAFPETVEGKQTRLLFPVAPKVIAEYLNEMIKEPLAAALLQKASVDEIKKNIGIEFEKMKDNKGMFNPFAILHIDTLLISSRHMFRSVYSLNEKSGLVSVPIKPDKVLEFDPKSAKPENVVLDGSPKFLDTTNVKQGQANDLFVQAFDFAKKAERQEKKEQFDKSQLSGDVEVPEEAVPEEYFPPCIKKILEGLEDGRKRAVFILINFLSCVGWSYGQIEARLREWNKCNREALREQGIVSQLRYHKQRKQKILPPNCDNLTYYKDLGVDYCDNKLCQKTKNPASYVKKRLFLLNREKKGKKNKK